MPESPAKKAARKRRDALRAAARRAARKKRDAIRDAERELARERRRAIRLCGSRRVWSGMLCGG
jgi:hypothetical protein